MGVVIGVLFVQIFMQTNLAVLQRNAQFNQSSLNDKALSLSNDLIVGCRTIKCYGWE
jgi:hypothetical protein